MFCWAPFLTNNICFYFSNYLIFLSIYLLFFYVLLSPALTVGDYILLQFCVLFRPQVYVLFFILIVSFIVSSCKDIDSDIDKKIGKNSTMYSKCFFSKLIYILSHQTKYLYKESISLS